MKKAILAALLCAALLSACGSPSSGTSSLLSQKNGVIEIKEKLFIAQTNEIYLNWQDYLGSTIRYEGIFDKLTYGDPPVDYYYVIRYGPGCCAYDSNAGFEVTWDGKIPEVNAWVEAEGVLERYEMDGIEYIRLKLSSLIELKKRGEEYVYQ